MKRKLIERLQVSIPKRKDKKILGKAQTEKEYLVLDLFRERMYVGRYVLDTQTGEHAYTLDAERWHSYKLLRAIGYEPMYESFYSSRVLKDFEWDTKADEQLAKKALSISGSKGNPLVAIQNMEKDYDEGKRLRAKEAKYRRIDKLMNEIPKEDEAFREWAYKSCKEGYLFLNKESQKYGCSNCGTQVSEEELGKPKQGEIKKCPECGQRAVIKKRSRQIWSINVNLKMYIFDLIRMYIFNYSSSGSI